MTQPAFRFDELAPERPRLLTCDTSAEFLSLCDRQDRGELEIESVSVGDGKGQWVVSVRWK